MSKELKTIPIKGKDYVLVNERIKAFRENFGGWSMESEFIELSTERCVMKAIIRDENGTIRATGTAYEDANSTYINKTSYIENCETSAWGRALGNLGIGIDTSIASADEMQNAIANQERNEKKQVEDYGSQQITNTEFKQLKQILEVFAKQKQDALTKAICEKYSIARLSVMTMAQFNEVRKTLLDAAPDGMKENFALIVGKFAKKANNDKQAAQQWIEDGIGKKLTDVEIAEFPAIRRKIGEMYKDL